MSLLDRIRRAIFRKTPRGTAPRLDPFTLSEPWRRFAQDALSSRRQFEDAVRRTQSGPTQDRLASLGEQINASIAEVFDTARAGHELSDALSRIGAPAVRRQIEALERDQGELSDRSETAAETLEALSARVATADRMAVTIADTERQLRLINARLSEAVTRCIELSVGAFLPDEFSAVEGTVTSITDELEALRAALNDTPGRSQASGA